MAGLVVQFEVNTMQLLEWYIVQWDSRVYMLIVYDLRNRMSNFPSFFFFFFAGEVFFQNKLPSTQV